MGFYSNLLRVLCFTALKRVFRGVLIILFLEKVLMKAFSKNPKKPGAGFFDQLPAEKFLVLVGFVGPSRGRTAL